jgi:hypothetical protein
MKTNLITDIIAETVFKDENGEYHREDGPAYEQPDGFKSWYLNGLCHREDGPAVERINGPKSWWLNGNNVSRQEFNDFLLRKRLQKIMEL